MTGPDERAENAFRDALRRHADDLDPAPLVAPARRRRWLPAIAAAAAVAVVAASAFVATRGDGPPAASGEHRPASNATATTGPSHEVRQVSWRGVEVDVPASWGDAVAPGSDWCAFTQGPGKPPFPRAAYVARDTTLMGVQSIGCSADSGAPAAFPTAPPRYWAPHVSFGIAEAGSTDGTQSFRGWTLDSRTVGGVRVSVLTDASTAGDAGPILDSAHAVETDANGCDSTSPVQAKHFVRPAPAFDVQTIRSVESVSICLYARSGDTTSPGLLGSRQITDVEAMDLLLGVEAEPAGGGPDAPEHCLPDSYGDSGLVLRLHSGADTYDLFVYYDSCFGNGIDDGTTRRALSQVSCLPLWGGRVQLASASRESYERCVG
jgi:hypothetical protein